MQPTDPTPPRDRPSIWPTLAFLVGFAILLIAITRYYLIPALEVFQNAAPRDQKLMSAHSALLLAILLLILASGLILTFRVGRFFFPRGSDKRTKTKYVDAWAEAGKRTPPE